MKTLTSNVRLTCAVIAVATTLGLFGTIVSLAEPQRSVLMARNQRIQTLPAAAPVEVAMASNSVTPAGK
jgi:biopolymer transport protein ExbB/TolQ